MIDPKQTPPTVRIRLKTLHITRTSEVVPAVLALGPAQIVAILTAIYSDYDVHKEHFVALALNARNRVSGWHLVSIGSANASIVHPRELFSAMLRLDAVSVILCHNHPSGEVDPSDDDLALTRRIVQAGDLLGIAVVDHIIVGPVPETGLPNWTSLKQEGYL